MQLSDSLYVGLIFAGFAVSLTGLALLHPGLSQEEPQQATLQAGPGQYYTVSGEKYIVHPDRMYTLCLGEDCIPALYEDDVAYESADAADTWLTSSDMVVGVVTDSGAAYAYPFRVLQHHYVVNTRLEGRPVAVTYSPHSASTAVFSRNVPALSADAESPLSFGASGKLLKGNLVMQDQETGSLWSQYRGEAVYGEQTATHLTELESHVARWGLWKDRYPSTTVLSRPDTVYNRSRYEDDPYFSYRSSRSVPVDTFTDNSPLHPKDIVYGVQTNGYAKAFKEVHVKDAGMITDTIGGTPILLVQDPETGIIRRFDRRIQGQTVEFTYHEAGNTLEDSTGTIWALNGTAVRGPLQGRQLETIDVHRMYWFSWNLFNPGTQYYEPS